MVITQADKDRELSFSIINYLSASYRGKLASFTLLGQLAHASFDQNEMTVLQHITDKIAEWFDGFKRGEILFCTTWEAPETFDAQNALNILTKLKPELLETAQRISGFLAGKEQVDSENAKWLFSNLIRSSFARDIYLRGFIIYGEIFGKPEIVNSYTAMLERAAQHNDLVRQGVELFRQAQYDLNQLGADFVMTLMTGCEELPAVFRTHVQDINLLAANYRGGISFENLDFSKDEASEWQLVGIGPEAAGYWRAFGFGAQETIAWLQSMINDPGEATAWKMSNFTAESAKSWRELGFDFQSTMLWHGAGYVPHIAKEHVDRGESSPPPEPE